MKSFISLQNASGMLARDYIKAKRRTDIGVVLEEFVDDNKTVLSLTYQLHDPKTAKTYLDL